MTIDVIIRRTVLILLTVSSSSFAQLAALENRLTVNGEIRLRSEVDSKDFNQASDANKFSLLRTRLGLDFKLADDVTAFVQFQDSRTFGEEVSTLSAQDNIDLHQGYVTFNNLFGAQGLSVTAGRMEMLFGGQRLVGPVGWDNVGRSFDGARVIYDPESAKVEFWSARLAENYQNGEDLDQSIYGIDLEIKASPQFVPRGYLIAETDGVKNSAGMKLLSRQTIGFHATGRVGGFGYDFETAVQRGEQAGEDISAYLLAASAGYTFNSPAKPRLSAGVDFLSGDDDPSAGEIKAFNTLYATNHKFYGQMDYFLNIPAHTGNRGLVDYMLKAEVNPHPKCLLRCDLHFFRNAEQDAGGDTDIGTEIDLNLGINTRKGVGNVFGLSVFSPGDVFKKTRGDRTAWWVYHMVTVKF